MIDWFFEMLRKRALRRQKRVVRSWERQRARTPMERMLATAALLRASQGRQRR